MPPEIDPTQQGGQEEEIKPTANPRNAAMAEIAKNAHASVQGELASFDEDTGEIQKEEKQEEPVQAQQEEESPKEAVEAKKEDLPPPKMVTIVVDGQPIEVEESRIIEAGKRTLQKDHAADRRLQEAAQAKRQAEQLLQQAQRLSNPDAVKPEPTPSQDASQPAHQPLDEVSLDTLLERKLYMRDAGKAAEKFWKDFPEIASDPHLRSIAINLENRRLETAAALGESYGDPFDAYQKHGEEIKKWLAERAGTAQAPAVQTMADKKDAKRTITTVQAASAKPPAPKEPKVLTTSELIEQMRENRGKGRQFQVQRIQ